MKVEYVQVYNNGKWLWAWCCAGGESILLYTRRRDAARGFARHCEAIRKVK